MFVQGFTFLAFSLLRRLKGKNERGGTDSTPRVGIEEKRERRWPHESNQQQSQYPIAKLAIGTIGGVEHSVCVRFL